MHQLRRSLNYFCSILTLNSEGVLLVLRVHPRQRKFCSEQRRSGIRKRQYEVFWSEDGHV